MLSAVYRQIKSCVPKDNGNTIKIFSSNYTYRFGIQIEDTLTSGYTSRYDFECRIVPK